MWKTLLTIVFFLLQFGTAQAFMVGQNFGAGAGDCGWPTDYFTETVTTPLEDHTPDCGDDWDESNDFETTTMEINSSGELIKEGTGTDYTRMTKTPPSNDMWAKIRMRIDTADANGAGVLLRAQDYGSGDEDLGIRCKAQSHTNSDWYLLCHSVYSGNFDQIGTTQGCGNRTEGATYYRLYADVSGSSPNIVINAWLKDDTETTTYCSLTNQTGITGLDTGNVGVTVYDVNGAAYIDWVQSGAN